MHIILIPRITYKNSTTEPIVSHNYKIPYMVKGLTVILAGTNSSVVLELGSKVTMAPSAEVYNNLPPVKE